MERKHATTRCVQVRSQMAGARRTIDGHRKIMLALRLRDPNLCEGVMRDHIREAKEDALQAMFPETKELNGKEVTG